MVFPERHIDIDELNKERKSARDAYISLTESQAIRLSVSPSELFLADGFILLTDSTTEMAGNRKYSHQTAWGTLHFDANVGHAITPLPINRNIYLTRRETTIFEKLISHPTRVHEYESLGDKDLYAKANIDLVRTNIHRIRRKLGHTSEKPLIYTYNSQGYSLEPNIPHQLSK